MEQTENQNKTKLRFEEYRRFEDLWNGVDDPESRTIHLRDNGTPSPARRRNRLFYLSFIVSAITLAVAIAILAKLYL